MTNSKWWTEAACLALEREGVPVQLSERIDIFFPNEKDKKATAPAKAICLECPVIVPCLDDAILEERHTVTPSGIRGGLTGLEREKERIRREGGYASSGGR